MEDKKNTGARVKQLRENTHNSETGSKGLTQEQFADSVYASKDTIAKIEQGKISLSVDNAMKIADFCGVSLDYLYGRTKDTQDTASTMMLYLKKLFDYRYDKGYCTPVTIAVDQRCVDFLNGYAQPTALYEAGTIPKEAYDPWVAKLKADFDAAMKNDAPADKREYLLVDKEQFGEPFRIVTITRGTQTATPPVPY